MQMVEVLIVDDEKGMRRALSILLKKRGYGVSECPNGRQALEKLRTKFFDLVITDQIMEPIAGMELLKQIKRLSPATEVIVMTAYGTVKDGVEAMKLGAYDYITKPFTNEEMTILVERALQKRRLEEEINRLKMQMQRKYSFDGIIGTSEPMLKVLELVSQVCHTDSTVLISGESGTGKELIAKALHANSPRKRSPLVTINCGALPENLQESELFGHLRGSFTGAVRDKKGLFEEADGGSLFLDEVGETASTTQVKLLRFLQEGEIRKVGDNNPIRVDVRLIAATNKNLEEEVAKGNFRKDLFYRLSVIPIHVPPLRQRREDIPLLIDYFVKRYADKMHKPVKGFCQRALAMMINYHWPGNVRELENVVERAVILASKEQVTPDNLPPQLWGDTQWVMNSQGRRYPTLAEVERDYILKTLQRCQGNKKRAAEELRISKSTLWRKLSQYGLHSCGQQK